MNAGATDPYAPPSSDPAPPPVVELPQFPLASPWIRLGSAAIDGVINLVVFHLIRMTCERTGVFFPVNEANPGNRGINYGGALVGAIVFYAIQWWWLGQSGQTIGKKLTRIRIATMSGAKPSLTDLLVKRYGFMNILSFIPIVGGLISLVDLLSIFRKDHRCLHDQIAGTQVIRMVDGSTTGE